MPSDLTSTDVTGTDEIIQLRRTIVAMRSELEAARVRHEEAVHVAVTAEHAEVTELRKTIQAMRDALEQERIRHAQEEQEIRQTAHDEQQQLQRMIVALREMLEAASGR